MTLSERQDKERKALKKEIREIEEDAGGWGDFNPEIAALSDPLIKALALLEADPETYFKTIDNQENEQAR